MRHISPPRVCWVTCFLHTERRLLNSQLSMSEHITCELDRPSPRCRFFGSFIHLFAGHFGAPHSEGLNIEALNYGHLWARCWCMAWVHVFHRFRVFAALLGPFLYDNYFSETIPAHMIAIFFVRRLRPRLWARARARWLSWRFQQTRRRPET